MSTTRTQMKRKVNQASGLMDNAADHLMTVASVYAEGAEAEIVALCMNLVEALVAMKIMIDDLNRKI